MRKLIGFAKHFTRENIPELSLAEKLGRQYFLVDKSLDEDLQSIKKKLKANPYSVGLLLGEIKDNQFKPGFPFLDILARHHPSKIVVNKKGETMFLYGKSVLRESIISTNQSEGWVLVMNERGEVIGCGEIKKGGDDMLVTNFINRADFLKREGKRRE